MILSTFIPNRKLVESIPQSLFGNSSQGNSLLKGDNTCFLSSIRLAEKSDTEALCDFYTATFGGDENVSRKYAKLVLNHGRTYVSDIGSDFPFIISAVTVLPTNKGEKYLSFMGTLPPLRRRGIMKQLLEKVIQTEKTVFDGDKFICFPKNDAFRESLRKIGFVFDSHVLRCHLKGTAKRSLRFHTSYAVGLVISDMRKRRFGADGFSDDAFFDIYSYFHSMGGYICTADSGFIAFMPEAEEKGKYKIAEYALDISYISSLPAAFEECILPAWFSDDLIKANIPFEKIPYASSNFDISDRYINQLFKF